MATLDLKRWKPSWWKEETHGDAWERVKEALRRDWQQTKHDVHAGGHELNQKASDTVRQMAGKQPIPSADQLNPPKVIGSFDEAEPPLGYGYGAQHQYPHRRFSDVEPKLRSDWDPERTGKKWEDVRDYVRRGYEYDRHSLV